MKHNIKLAAVDIDGIFVRLDYTYDVPRFKRILSRMKEAGCSFIVASGNQYYQMREELSFVAENGAFVKDRQAERRGILPEQCAAFGDGGKVSCFSDNYYYFISLSFNLQKILDSMFQLRYTLFM